MVKNKCKKLLIVIFVIFFCIMSVNTSVMAGDIVHIGYCNMPNCSMCIMINFSIDFVRNIGVINVDILILIILVSIVQLTIRYIKETRKLTLVELKVVQIK